MKRESIPPAAAAFAIAWPLFCELISVHCPWWYYAGVLAMWFVPSIVKHAIRKLCTKENPNA